MSNAEPLSSRDSLGAPKAEPLKMDEPITVRHLNGRQATVTFEQITGDKLDQVDVRWGIAGMYAVDLKTGKLYGGKPKKKASVWSVIPADLARLHATAEQQRAERRERMRKNKK